VETIFDTASRNEMLDEPDFDELVTHLEAVCDLLGLHTDFLEGDDE